MLMHVIDRVHFERRKLCPLPVRVATAGLEPDVDNTSCMHRTRPDTFEDHIARASLGRNQPVLHQVGTTAGVQQDCARPKNFAVEQISQHMILIPALPLGEQRWKFIIAQSWGMDGQYHWQALSLHLATTSQLRKPPRSCQICSFLHRRPLTVAGDSPHELDATATMHTKTINVLLGLRLTSWRRTSTLQLSTSSGVSATTTGRLLLRPLLLFMAEPTALPELTTLVGVVRPARLRAPLLSHRSRILFGTATLLATVLAALLERALRLAATGRMLRPRRQRRATMLLLWTTPLRL